MIYLGLGASRPGAWGTPSDAIARTVEELGEAGFDVCRCSSLYETASMGPGHTGVFVNAAVAGRSHLAPEALLHVLKRLERKAGGRSAMPWGPRALDIDILDYKGRIAGWRLRADPGRPRAEKRLVLPHPALHVRPFVLAPLCELDPGWRHPVLRVSARELWRRVRDLPAGRILRRRAT